MRVITDWPISYHMIGTSHRGPIQRAVPRGLREHAQAKMSGAVYEWQPAPALLLSGC
ncbi:unnamed protein product [Staurois parvus]|uniref:Uncharacterized protein n=1 Tax=Staurois parvus TaxID=386267 RepID=A0ABN9G9Y7_9NEOB|nr:unnamed protein product [Staurois parvus]